MSKFDDVMFNLGYYSKAVWAAVSGGVLAFLAAVGGAMADGDLTRAEVVIAIGAGVVALAATGGVVYGSPKNREQ